MYTFGSRWGNCPSIDDSVVLGADQADCGLHGSIYHCDHWNLTNACEGPAAVPGTDKMNEMCNNLCTNVPGCRGFMVDTATDPSSGLCILGSEGSFALADSCFVYASSDLVLSDADCHPPCAICGDGGTKRRLTHITFKWRSSDGAGTTVSASGAFVTNGGAVSHDGTVTVSSSGGRLGASLELSTPSGSADLHVSCSVPLALQQAVSFPDGELVLVGFVDTTGETENDVVCDGLGGTDDDSDDGENGATCPNACADRGSRPTSLTFTYTPATAITPNPQNGKATVQGHVSGAATVACLGADVNPTTSIAEGGTFVLTPRDGRFAATTPCALSGDDMSLQLVAIHTSCSLSLSIGDAFGSMALSGYNGVVYNTTTLNASTCQSIVTTSSGGKHSKVPKSSRGKHGKHSKHSKAPKSSGGKHSKSITGSKAGKKYSEYPSSASGQKGKHSGETSSMGKKGSRPRRSKKNKQDKKRSKSGWQGTDVKTCIRPTSTYSANVDHATKVSRPDYSSVVTGILGAVFGVGMIVGAVVVRREAKAGVFRNESIGSCDDTSQGGTSAADRTVSAGAGSELDRNVSAAAGSELDRLEYDNEYDNLFS